MRRGRPRKMKKIGLIQLSLEKESSILSKPIVDSSFANLSIYLSYVKTKTKSVGVK